MRSILHRAEHDEEWDHNVVTGVSCDPFAYVTWCAHLATLPRFDDKVLGMVNNGPLIPCERRLEKSEIQENQEVTSRGRFENRDYGRPFRCISVTLRRFD